MCVLAKDLTHAIFQTEGIAYDWVHHKVVWSDQRLRRILSMNTDRSERTTVMITEKPRAIALDPCRGSVHVLSHFFLFKVSMR